MRILIFHNLLWSQYKSVIFEKLNEEICAKNDSELLVIQTSITEKSRTDLVDFKLSDFPFKYPFKLISNKPLESVSHLKIFISKIKYIITFKPDVVNFTGYNEPSTIILLILCKILGIKSIITNESIDKKHPVEGISKRIKSFYKVILFKLTDGFFSYGIQSNEYLFKHGVPKSKILSFLNTFDKKKFIASNDKITLSDKYLLFVGRLSSEKNLIELIRCFKNVHNCVKDLKLLIIGNGPEKEFLLNEISKLNLNNEVLLLGTIQWNLLSQYYENAECLILPSISETWGMVANEAQELNLPVISTDNCGCSNDLILNNYSGLVLNGDLASDINVNLIIDYVINDKKQKLQKFISKNKSIFDLERLSFEMIKGFHYLLKK